MQAPVTPAVAVSPEVSALLDSITGEGAGTGGDALHRMGYQEAMDALGVLVPLGDRASNRAGNPKALGRLVTAYRMLREHYGTGASQGAVAKIHSGDRRKAFGRDGDISTFLHRNAFVGKVHNYKAAEAGFPFGYEVNAEVFRALKDFLKARVGEIDEKGTVKFKKQFWTASRIEGVTLACAHEFRSGRFEYHETEKSGRLFHRITNMPSGERSLFLAGFGYVHDYDMTAAQTTFAAQATEGMPKLLAQILQWDDLLPVMMNAAGINRDGAKLVRTVLMTGQKMPNVWPRPNRPGQWIHQVFEGPAHFKAAMDDKVFSRAVRSLEKAASEAGDAKAIRLAYYDFEKTFRDVVQDYCDRKGIKVFLIHDGFVTDKAINIRQVVKLIDERTGVRVKLTHDKLNGGGDVS